MEPALRWTAPPDAGDRAQPPAGDGSLEIVIVSYRCRDLLFACLQSIAINPYTAGATAITVVDNASADGTVAAVRAAFPAVRLVGLSENLGFAAANNVALRESRAEHILLLNPDTEIWPEVLDAMARFLCEHPAAGVAGCRLVRRDGSFDHAAKRSIPTIAAALRHFQPGGSSSSYLAPHVAEHESGSVDAVNGAFMLIRREAMEEAGLLDEGYWMYGEDLDWCTRFRRAGWDVLYNGRVTTLHVKGATAGSHRRLRQNVAFHHAMGRFYRRHIGGRHALLDGVVYTGIVAKLGFSVCRSLYVRTADRTRR
jgi:N-acetylglucosaminyl-diphospho-decaprenol L-rhamnosyltransferase